MKDKFLKVIQVIQQKQTGLFRITVLSLLIYCAYQLHNISENTPDISSIESEVSSISATLDEVKSDLSSLSLSISYLEH